MVLGNSMSVLLKLEVDISEISKLQAARQRLSAFEKKSNRAQAAMSGAASSGITQFTMFARVLGSTDNQLSRIISRNKAMEKSLNGSKNSMLALSAAMSAGFKKIRAGAAKATASIRQMNISMQQAKMSMLGLMFTSLNMVFIFGSILALSPRIRARFMEIVGAMRLIAIEAGEILGPHLGNLAETIRNLDEDQRELIATIAILGTIVSVAGVLIGAFGQAALTVVSGLSVLRTGLLALASHFGLVSSVSSGSLTGAISGISAASAGLAGLIALVAAFAAAYETNFMGVRETTNDALTAPYRRFPGVVNTAQNAINNFIGAALKSYGRLLKATAKLSKGFKKTFDKQLMPLLKTAGVAFIKLDSQIRGSFRSSSEAVRAFKNLMRDVGGAAIDILEAVASTVQSKLAAPLNSIITKINDAAAALPKVNVQLPEFDMPDFGDTEEKLPDEEKVKTFSERMKEARKEMQKTAEGRTEKRIQNFEDSLDSLSEKWGESNEKLKEQAKELINVGDKMQELKLTEKSTKKIIEKVNKLFDEHGSVMPMETIKGILPNLGVMKDEFEVVGDKIKFVGDKAKEAAKKTKEAGKETKEAAKKTKDAGKKTKDFDKKMKEANKQLKKFKDLKKQFKNEEGGFGLIEDFDFNNDILNGTNVSKRKNSAIAENPFLRKNDEGQVVVNNDINLEAEVDDQIDVDRFMDKVNEELQRTTKRSGFNL